MLDLDVLLRPISDAQPSGANLRRDGIYDQLEEARREDEADPAGDWERKRKKSKWPLVYKLATEALAKRTKDLNIAARLTESLLHLQGWQGLAQGLLLIRELQERFWETLYPQLEQEDDNPAELRAKPLNWLVTRLEYAVQ